MKKQFVEVCTKGETGPIRHPDDEYTLRFLSSDLNTLVVVPLNDICSFSELQSHINKVKDHLPRPFLITGGGKHSIYNNAVIGGVGTGAKCWLQPDESWTTLKKEKATD
jgi:hypothetical protein